MEITRIAFLRLEIPFAREVSHARYSRNRTESLVVVVTDEGGLCGYGEGAPRTYVTGESLPASFNAAKQLAGQLEGRCFHSFQALSTALSTIADTPIARRHPAAWCALELGCLDLWGQRHKQPVWRLFSPDPPQMAFTYSMVLPIVENSEQLAALVQFVKSLQPLHMKVKVSEFFKGVAVLKLVREKLGPEVDLRVDANGAFSVDEAIDFVEAIHNLNISSIEQPVARDDLAALKAVSQCSRIPVVADESMYAGAGVESFIENRICHGINIRLSSCGGIQNSRRLWKLAVSRGMTVQVGCHVGESAILSMAGRHLAALGFGNFYLEGSFSKYLLKNDLVDDDISFGEKGLAPIPAAPGLGVAINRESLHQWTRPFM